MQQAVQPAEGTHLDILCLHQVAQTFGKLFPRVYLRAAGGCALGCICTAQADVSAPNTSYGSCSSGNRLLALNGVRVEVALTRRFKPCG